MPGSGVTTDAIVNQLLDKSATDYYAMMIRWGRPKKTAEQNASAFRDGFTIAVSHLRNMGVIETVDVDAQPSPEAVAQTETDAEGD